MTEDSVQTVLSQYRLEVDVISALGFIVAKREVSENLFGKDFYDSCEHAFRNCHID